MRIYGRHLQSTCTMKMVLAITLIVFGLLALSQCQDVAIVPDQQVRDGKPTDFNLQSNGKATNNERFVPTDEWQTVKEGQAIPAGLHVRLNLATGAKEAKLLDDPSGSANKKLSLPEVERALKDLRTSHSDDLAPSDTANNSPPSTTTPRSQFRSYEELKEEYAKMGMAIKSDNEIMKDLITSYKNKETKTEKRLAVLEDLEYLAHQLDNGVNFVEMGGLKMVGDTLNVTIKVASMPGPTITLLHSRIAHLIGSAAQSNPPVQIAILESGLLEVLLRNLDACVHSTDVDDALKHRLIYALTATIRSFPHAQQKFIDLHGLDLVNSILNDESTSPWVERIQLRFITLLYDLMQERQLSLEHDDNKERQSQYAALNWIQYIKDYNWCLLIRDWYLTLIDSSSTSGTDFTSLNFADRVLDLLTIMWQMNESECRRYFDENQISRLQDISSRFTDSMSRTDDEDQKEFMGDVADKLRNIATMIRIEKREL